MGRYKNLAICIAMTVGIWTIWSIGHYAGENDRQVSAAQPAKAEPDSDANANKDPDDRHSEEFQALKGHLAEVAAAYPDVVVHDELPMRIRIGNPDGECSFVAYMAGAYQWPAGSQKEYKNPWQPVAEAIKECGKRYGEGKRIPFPDIDDTLGVCIGTLNCSDSDTQSELSAFEKIWQASPVWLQEQCSSSESLKTLESCIYKRSLDAMNKDTTMVSFWLP